MEQREIPILGNVKKEIEATPERFLRTCKTRLDAFNLTINLAGMPDYLIAELLGIDRGNFSKMRRGSANFPLNMEHDLYDLCGNRAMFEWDCYMFRLKTVPLDRDEEIARLEAQLDALKEAV